MDLFDVLSLVGGLALFLYGMHVMGEGLAKASGGRLEQILEKLTSNLFKAVALGAAVTAVIQSSSATTVMVVGFVNSGIMKLSQAVGRHHGCQHWYDDDFLDLKPFRHRGRELYSPAGKTDFIFPDPGNHRCGLYSFSKKDAAMISERL